MPCRREPEGGGLDWTGQWTGANSICVYCTSIYMYFKDSRDTNSPQLPSKIDTQLGSIPAQVRMWSPAGRAPAGVVYVLCAPCRHSEPVGRRANLRMTSWPTIHRHMACDVPYQSLQRIYLPASPAHITVHPELLPV